MAVVIIFFVTRPNVQPRLGSRNDIMRMYDRVRLTSLCALSMIPLVSTIFGLTPLPAQAAPQLGVNGTVDWVDLAKMPRWQQYNSVPYTQDSAGWPSSDFIWVVDDRRGMPWNGPDPNGRNNDASGVYKLSFT